MCGRVPTSLWRTARSAIRRAPPGVRCPRRARLRPRTAGRAHRGRGPRKRPPTASRDPLACGVPVSCRSERSSDRTACLHQKRGIPPVPWTGVACARGLVRQGTCARQNCGARRSGPRPSDVLARGRRCGRDHGAALHVALLVYVGPRVVARHKPLPGRDRGDPTGVARTRILRGSSTRWPTSLAPSAGPPRCTRRPGGDPSRSHAWRGVHAALWSRSGAARRPANQVGDVWDMLTRL